MSYVPGSSEFTASFLAISPPGITQGEAEGTPGTGDEGGEVRLSPSHYLGHPEQSSQAQPPILSAVSTETDIGNRQSPSFQTQVSSKTCSHMIHRLHDCEAAGVSESVPPSTGCGEGSRDWIESSWLPVQCSSHAASNPGGPAATLPVSLVCPSTHITRREYLKSTRAC